MAARVAGLDCEGPPRSSAPPCSPAPPARGAPGPTLQHGRGRVEVEGHGLHQVVVGAQALQLVPHQHRLAGARVPHQHHRPRLRHEQVHEVADADGFRGVHQRGLRGAEGGWGVTLRGPGESPAPPPHSRAHPNRAAPPFSSGALQLSRAVAARSAHGVGHLRSWAVGYLQWDVGVQLKGGDLVRPRQELLGVRVQVVVEDGPLRGELDRFEFVDPPFAELNAVVYELRGSRSREEGS